ncbi:hypothetical protein [Clavibacter zhangzhiyongii]|uniref:hypothetical protein n=1 Tax=Clavibacter zhangzhiyongii TaxID=2768071 RepID=UPI00195B991A|nr:hypothetical protein [Clavibacter zhangzhiyongii]MBM7025037.1 hypothetical protein [Clavibacter zhangzhiyongii]
MPFNVKLACYGTKEKGHDQRIVAKFRWIAATGATGWHRLDRPAYLKMEDLTYAMVINLESSAADGRHDFLCEGCGNKVDRLGSSVVARLERARANKEKVVPMDLSVH